MKTSTITNNMTQNMKISLVLRKPIKTAPKIPTIIQRITNKRRWIINL